MEILKISCNISSSDPSAQLGLEIWLNDQQLLNQDHVQGPMSFNHDLSDHEAEHTLSFVLKNKTAEHTIVDDSGNIVKDACLIIEDLAFNEIQLGHLLIEQAVYVHDFNGTQSKIEDKFFGTMGCNGTVSLKFTTPIYLWLLEHM